MTEEVKKHKRGDIRDDGMVFMNYAPRYRNGEYWVSPEMFASLLGKQRIGYEKSKAELVKGSLKAGHVREDGMVFRSYAAGATNGEHWVTPEKFRDYATSNAQRVAKMREDPAYAERLRSERREKYANDASFRESMLEFKRTPEQRRRQNELRRTDKGRKRRAEYARTRRTEDPVFNFKSRVRVLIRDSFRRGGFLKNSSTELILGCSFEEFKEHIENQFTDGMSWERFSDIHIDHIIPLASAATEGEVTALNHYTNLQPLWAEDNLKKGSKGAT